MIKSFLLLLQKKINVHIVLTIVSVKLIIVFIAFCSFSLLPFATKYYFANFHYPVKQQITFQTSFMGWDAQHYLYLSEKGYSPNIDSDAFPPLFPFLIYAVSFIVKNHFVAGILVSNICSFAALYLFYVLVKKMYEEKIAYRSLLFLLIFPTSFYFSFIYTESLFFLLVILFFFFLQKKELLYASLVAFFMPLARLIGIAIEIPFLFSLILEYYNHKFDAQLSVITTSLYNKKTLLLFSPFVGLFVYMLIMYMTTGSFFTAFTIQQYFISHFSLFSIFNPLFFLKALFTFPLQIHGFANSLLDRMFFLGFLAFLPLLYNRVSKVFFIYAVVFAVLPVLSGSFMSYTRYLLMAFPIFIAFAKISFEKKYEKITFSFIYFCLLLQSLFLIMQSLNYWVS